MRGEKEESLNVYARFRPPSQREVKFGVHSCIYLENEQKVEVDKHTYTFDYIFKQNTPQKDIYKCIGEKHLNSVLDGYNSTILAYGQTSAGKTYTMEGPDIENLNPHYIGLIPRILDELFRRIKDLKSQYDYEISLTMIEIYNETVYDLLTNNEAIQKILKVRGTAETGFFIQGISQRLVKTKNEAINWYIHGCNKRRTSATEMNELSSRSHSVLTVTIKKFDKIDEEMKTSIFNLVDLAGSERFETKNDQTVINESILINQSLSALGLVIKSLVDIKRGKNSSSYVPYRNSILTQVLQNSLGGNCRTSLILCCSPAVCNKAETISTLQFGERAKLIKNKVTQNVTSSVPELKAKIRLLEAQIAKYQQQDRVKNITNDEIEQIVQINQQYEQEIQRLTEELLNYEKKETSSNRMILAFQTKIADMEESCPDKESYETEIEKLKEKIRKLAAHCNQLVREKNELQSKLNKSNYSSYYGNVDDKDKKIMELESQVEDLKNQVNYLETSLETNTHELQEAETDYKKRLYRLQREKSCSSNLSQSCISPLKTSSFDWSTSDMLPAPVKRSIAELQMVKRNLENQLADLTDRIESLDEMNGRQELALKEKDKRLREFSEQLGLLQTELLKEKQNIETGSTLQSIELENRKQNEAKLKQEIINLNIKYNDAIAHLNPEQRKDLGNDENVKKLNDLLNSRNEEITEMQSQRIKDYDTIESLKKEIIKLKENNINQSSNGDEICSSEKYKKLEEELKLEKERKSMFEQTDFYEKYQAVLKENNYIKSKYNDLVSEMKMIVGNYNNLMKEISLLKSEKILDDNAFEQMKQYLISLDNANYMLDNPITCDYDHFNILKYLNNQMISLYTKHRLELLFTENGDKQFKKDFASDIELYFPSTFNNSKITTSEDIKFIKNDEITLRVCYQLLEMFLKMIGLTLIYNEEDDVACVRIDNTPETDNSLLLITEYSCQAALLQLFHHLRDIERSDLQQCILERIIIEFSSSESLVCCNWIKSMCLDNLLPLIDDDEVKVLLTKELTSSQE